MLPEGRMDVVKWNVTKAWQLIEIADSVTTVPINVWYDPAHDVAGY